MTLSVISWIVRCHRNKRTSNCPTTKRKRALRLRNARWSNGTLALGLSVVVNPGGRGHRGQAEQVLARVFVALHISRRRC